MAECGGLAVTLVIWMLLVATAQARELKQIKYSSIPDVLLRQPELSIFLDAVMTAGISFPANEPVTLFAPNNKAFDAFDEDKQPRNLQKYTGLTLEQLFLPANRHKLVQLVKYNIVPSCIGYYSTFRPSMPPVLVVNSVATVGAASSTAVIVSGEQATQFSTTSALQPGLSQLVVQDRSSVQVSTPAATYPTRQVAPSQARSWAQPGSYTTYTVAKTGHTYGQGQTLGFPHGHRRRLSQQQGITVVTTDAVNVPCNSATALLKSQLTNGRVMWTALEGAMPLDIDGKDANDVEVEVSDNCEAKDADIKVPDIQAGRSIVHIVDEVLVPASIRTVSAAAG